VNEADDTIEKVNKAKAGDGRAFEMLVHATSRLVFAKLYLLTGNRHRVEDLVQETYLLAWKSIGQLTEPAQFRPWLLSIAHRVMLDDAKHASRKKRAGQQTATSNGQFLASIAGDTQEPSEAVGREETKQVVLNALNDLPETYSLPLALRYLAGCDYETIGKQLGLTNGSLQGRLHRGLKLLRGLLSEDFM
jgi:RNA polymerase sigma-70 factor, ECF subfamily